jgi:hypothetical protein
VVQTEPQQRPAPRADRESHLFEDRLDTLLTALAAPAPRIATDPAAGPDHARCLLIRAKRAEVSRALQAEPQLIGPLVEQLMDAVLHDINPSFNRLLIEPLLQAAPACATLRQLTDVIETGSRRQRICAANAVFWVWTLGVRTRDRHEFADITDRLQEICLRVFVTADDLDVRRAVDSWLSLDVTRYPARLHGLVRQAEQIARTEPTAFSALLLTT